MSPILRPSRSTLFESSTESLGRLIDGNGNEFRVPTYTIKEIRDAVPQECYNRSTIRGLGYVLRDASLWIITIYISWQYIPKIEFQPLRGILWCVSGFVTGLFATGLWVLAHECGHQAFSTSKVVNDTVGFTLHSILLVPYFAWKITHGKHHKSTGHMERDMVFVPKTREQFARRIGVLVDDISELTEDAPINTLVRLLGRQILGWPIYLFTNDTGHNFHERQTEGRGKGKRNGIFTGVNHFSPHSPLFEAKDSRLIVLSDIGIFGMGFILYLIGRQIGWTNLFLVYGMPWLWVHHWLGKNIFPLLMAPGLF
jgi:omega-6 fatty acid desaturase (delta-12 desaturase)